MVREGQHQQLLLLNDGLPTKTKEIKPLKITNIINRDMVGIILLAGSQVKKRRNKRMMKIFQM